MASPLHTYSHDDYTIAWITTLSVERVAAELMLDETHGRLRALEGDDNFYTLGRIGEHNVVLMTASRPGIDSVNHLATNMARTFRKLRFIFLIGIGGGAPMAPVGEDSDQHDLMLGDVVVSFQENEHDKGPGYVYQHDYGKHLGNGEFDNRSYIRKPPAEIINIIRGWKINRLLKRTKLEVYLQEAVDKARTFRKREYNEFKFPGRDKDELYSVGGEGQGSSDGVSTKTSSSIIMRLERDDSDPVVHYGLIASASSGMGNARRRDELRDKYGVMCFEMEAAGLMNDFPCFIVRGISNYSDGHKSDNWQPWASMTASAAAKDLLSVIQPWSIDTTKTVIEVIDRRGTGPSYPKSF
ncbi:hypothetical protein TWF481_009877 [Arthrobotrys musiformis]|uniref:Nucleoside phosphorylase domain-containing protein n=1 Tax=Arthrobotrys musiformis TaxID=47236 RepID=A0AAV9W537_9PEZI